jgi:hypothetical protein
MHITYAAIEKNWVHDIYPEAKKYSAYIKVFIYLF